jgi:hypothetical protein
MRKIVVERRRALRARIVRARERSPTITDSGADRCLTSRRRQRVEALTVAGRSRPTRMHKDRQARAVCRSRTGVEERGNTEHGRESLTRG